MNKLLQVFALSVAFSANAAERPNVVLIFADDMGYGDVSAYSPESRIKTPKLDRLVSEGMMFTDAHTASAVCTPSRYSLLTGRYAWRTRLKSGVLNGYSPPLIEQGRKTLASLLKQQGYTTGIIGKWHLGMNWFNKDGKQLIPARKHHAPDADYGHPLDATPTSNGFDYYYGISASLDMPPYVWIENDRVVTPPKPGYKVEGGRAGPAADGWQHKDVLPTIADKTIEFIRDNKKGPFFAYVPLNAPHTPHAPNEQFIGSSGLDVYGDFMVEVDHTIGRIIDAVDRMGLKDNTLIIVTSDNGPETNMYSRRQRTGHDSSSYFLGAKRDNWEGGHRVPFVVRWPDKVKAGQVNRQPIGTVDIFATLAEMTGQKIKPTEAEDSFSFYGLIRGQSDEDKRAQHAWIYHSSGGHFAIRQGDWKLLLHSGSGGNGYGAKQGKHKKRFAGTPEAHAYAESKGLQLYNMATDSAERVNLVDEYPEKVAELTRLAAKTVRDGRSTSGMPQAYVERPWSQIQWINKLLK